MPLSLKEVAADPELGESFTILRQPGAFGPGGWVPTSGPIPINARGIITIADDRALEQVPEGDRVHGSIQIVTTTPMYTTLAVNSATSDQVLWFGNKYRVQSVGPWRRNGFYSVIMTRMTGA